MGALPMALGEWISVKSSQEQYKRLMALEMLEIEPIPEGEMRELALIYMAEGIRTTWRPLPYRTRNTPIKYW